MPTTEPSESPVLCTHLQPHCDALLASGATIMARDTGWTDCRLNYVLSAGPTVAQMDADWTLPDHLEPWANRDPHYSIENGLFCKLCKMGMSWPHVEP